MKSIRVVSFLFFQEIFNKNFIELKLLNPNYLTSVSFSDVCRKETLESIFDLSDV